MKKGGEGEGEGDQNVSSVTQRGREEVRSRVRMRGVRTREEFFNLNNPLACFPYLLMKS